MRTLIGALAVLFSVATAPGETITVSAAISLKESLGKIAATYEKQTGEKIEFNFDASGKLAQQIAQGAPVDVFISADNEQADKLVKSGNADRSSRRVIARNSLVLIVPTDHTGSPASFADLGTSKAKVAAGDPRSVPAGRYAEQTLRALKIYDQVAPRLVLAENVRQVLTYVQRGEVEAGIVYRTDARVARSTVTVVQTADPQTHDAIEYPAVLVTASAHQQAGRKFLDYLKTQAASAVLTEYGFELPAETAPPEKSPTTRPAQ